MGRATVKRITVASALGVQVVSLCWLLLAGTDRVSVFAAIMNGITIILLMKGLLRIEYQPSIEQMVEDRVVARTKDLVVQMSKYEQQASTDALTGLLNRRGGEASIMHHIARSRRLGTSISFLLVDIDKFKTINDRFGHAIGDTVISSVASCLKENVRASDIVARWGGEEYLVCLPDTDLQGAIKVAEKIRSRVFAIDIQGPSIRVSISIGCSSLGQDDFSVALARADMNLYFAKSKGRNRVFPDFSENKLDRTQ